MNHIDNKQMKERFYKRLEKEKASKRKRKSYSYAFTTAALMATFITSSVFGQSILQSIRNFTVGENIHYFVVDDSYQTPLPDELQGMLFDEQGNEITGYGLDDTVYTDTGEEAFIVQDKDGSTKILNQEEYKASIADDYILVEDLAQVTQYFDPGVRFPSYLPVDEMDFSFAMIYDILDTGKNDFLIVTYYSENSVTFGWTVTDMGDTGAVGYYTSDEGSLTDDISVMEINGNKVTINGNRVYLEIDNLYYAFIATEEVSVDKIIKIVESM